MPKWSTPARRERLVELFLENANRCLRGHERCPDPLHYERDETEVWLQPEFVPQLGLWGTGKTVHHYTAVYEHRYQVVERDAVAEWVADDRGADRDARRAEQARLHDLGEKPHEFRHTVFSPERPPFDPVTAERFYERRPEFYVKGVGVGAVTFRKVAVVRVPSTAKLLWVELPTRLGKVARRRMRRYGWNPKALSPAERAIVQGAVRDWRKSVGLD